MIFKDVSVVCEGQTEVDFIKCLNEKYFIPKRISLKPVSYNKSTSMNGNVSVDRIVQYIKKAKHPIVTTFVDYYGFKHQSGRSVTQIEEEIKEKANKEFFIPYLQMHEIEALWFSDINAIKEVKNPNDLQVNRLMKIVNEYPNPEDINNSPQTAPSKRLESIFPDYQKVLDGKLISNKLSIPKIQEKCPRFSKWLKDIEDMANSLRETNY